MRDAHGDHVNAILDLKENESELPVVVRRRYVLDRRPLVHANNIECCRVLVAQRQKSLNLN